MQLMKTLSIAFIILLFLQSPVHSGPVEWICKSACWIKYRSCMNDAERLYRLCLRTGEEAQCQWIVDFQRDICSREYDDCMYWCTS